MDRVAEQHAERCLVFLVLGQVGHGSAHGLGAFLQPLPEFAVEAVLAWKQRVPLLLAGLTGALRLLTGLGWPMIYFTASMAYRLRTGQRLRRIRLEPAKSRLSL